MSTKSKKMGRKKLSSSKSSAKMKLSTLLFGVLAVPFAGIVVLLLSAVLFIQFGGSYEQQSTAANNGLSVIPEENTRRVVEDTNDKVKYHIIFSTGCSTFQDWQSYVFFYAAMANQQPGTVTRIVSGCGPDEEKTLLNIFREQIEPMSRRFKIHFTPDYSKIKPGFNFKYFNKPFGVKHWLENALQFGKSSNPIDKDSIVMLLDPDQLIVRPWRNNNFSNTDWKFVPQDQARTHVEHGKPMGQLYGFALQWKTKVNMSIVLPHEHSPIDDLEFKDAQSGYIVGPPYVATARDMYTIVKRWCQFAIPVHDQYPHLLAEMFAYCLGAAHERLPHQTASSFMVSDVSAGAKAEGWSYVDKIPAADICKQQSPEAVPNVIHFCQRYAIGPYFFGKYKMPKDILSCESPLLQEPPENVLQLYNKTLFPGGQVKANDEKTVKRYAFMTCTMIKALNEAATYFKQNHCKNANLKKSLSLFEG